LRFIALIRKVVAMHQDGPPELRHGMAEVEAGLRLHYVEAGRGPRAIVLVHGFPQTWWQWRHLFAPLVAAGFRVIAPDYRGAGDSWRPAGGYDKRTMASDIHRLVQDHLAIREPVVVAGHDIGLMIAFAYAARHPGAVSHLALMDAPLPGTRVFDDLRSDPRVWHFAFHGARDVAEMLVSGREREYIRYFVNARILNTAAISPSDLDVYAAAYAAPGAMRAAFETYRAFDRDADDNRAVLCGGKLKVPVLAVGGTASTTGAVIEEMAREVADDVTGVRVPGTAHWVAEENPEIVVRHLLDFATRSDGSTGRHS
jgi:pimeloyl-ACP methyl ester carboxylesterase